MIVIVRAQVTFELNRQLILLVAETTVEYFLYFLDLSLDFLLTLCYNLDCHHLHEAGSRSHQEIKSARKAQDPWKLMLPCDLPFPWKDRHKCYMLPTIRCRFEQESSINLRASRNENYTDKQARFSASSSVSSNSISNFLHCNIFFSCKKIILLLFRHTRLWVANTSLYWLNYPCILNKWMCISNVLNWTYCIPVGGSTARWWCSLLANAYIKHPINNISLQLKVAF